MRRAGRNAASTERSKATPFSTEGTRPDITSGQKAAIEPAIDICAEKTPSAAANIFSATARPVSPRQGVCRLASSARIGSRIIATIGILIISVLLVLAPILARLAEAHIEWIKPYMGTINSWRYVVASTVIVGGLFAVHYWLPAGRRPFLSLVPGILFTLVGWLIGSTAFASYLDHFSSYVTTYAGLASIMVAVVFLYIVSAIFILGGEFNAAISRYLEARARVAG